jgi:predicted acyl esterase
VFKKGHVLRLEVSSSNFPRFDRNLNTGEENGTGTPVSATNSVLHDAQHRRRWCCRLCLTDRRGLTEHA